MNFHVESLFENRGKLNVVEASGVQVLLHEFLVSVKLIASGLVHLGNPQTYGR